MKKQDTLYQSYMQILKEELISATGCTEPIALAYGAAVARKELGVIPERVVVKASGNLIKNVKSVIVPNTNHLKGIEAAVVAGIIAGDPDKQLEVVAQVSAEQKSEIKNYLETHHVEVEVCDTPLTFDYYVTLYAERDYVMVRIANYHTNLVRIEKNGKIILDIPVTDEAENDMTDRSCLNIKRILEFAESLDPADVKPIFDRQIKCNMSIAQEGLRIPYGANVGKVLQKSFANTVEIRARTLAAAGSDARMNGCEMPVVICSGSGNQGITASVPVIVYARDMGVSEEKLYRALAVSNLCTIHQKTTIGRLSAFCGAVSAGSGAGAGICYLNDGGYEGIIHTIVNALAFNAGIVCDGAKSSCAAKISMAVEAGIFGFQMWQNGQEFFGGDGIISKGVENTIRNVGHLGREGMRETDHEILKIMLTCS